MNNQEANHCLSNPMLRFQYGYFYIDSLHVDYCQVIDTAGGAH